MHKFSALIVDDEPLARERVRTLLTEDPEMQVIGECADGLSASEAIRSSAPDVLLLDVQVPEIDGFGVLEQLDSKRVPAVIFITAYDRYAVRAFQVQAVDYLLKPFDRERFHQALDRAKEHVRNASAGQLSERLLSLLEETPKAPKWQDRLLAKCDGRMFFVRVDEIDWLEGSGNYVRVHAATKSHMLRETMTALEATLNPAKFLRVHRSAIVNVDHIQEIEPWFRGDYMLVLQDGSKVILSRGYRDKFERVLGRRL